MIRALIFDCFGVIITDALSVICSDVGLDDAARQQAVADTVNAMNRGLMALSDGQELLANLLGISTEDLMRRIAGGETKDTALLDFIAGLRKKYKTAMLSNVGSRRNLNARFAEGELERCFDTTVASGDIGFAKPEARAYEYTAGLLGVRLEECLFIDDRTDYCQGARAVGMTAVLYRNFTQLQRDIRPLLVT